MPDKLRFSSSDRQITQKNFVCPLCGVDNSKTKIKKMVIDSTGIGEANDIIEICKRCWNAMIDNDICEKLFKCSALDDKISCGKCLNIHKEELRRILKVAKLE